MKKFKGWLRSVELGRSSGAGLALGLAGVVLSLAALSSLADNYPGLSVGLSLFATAIAIISGILFLVAERREVARGELDRAEMRRALALILELSSSKRGLLDRPEEKIVLEARLHGDLLAPNLFDRTVPGKATIKK